MCGEALYKRGAKGKITGMDISQKSLDVAAKRDCYEKLIKAIPEIRGLELPFWGKEIHCFGSEFLLELMQTEVWARFLPTKKPLILI